MRVYGMDEARIVEEGKKKKKNSEAGIGHEPRLQIMRGVEDWRHTRGSVQHLMQSMGMSEREDPSHHNRR